MIKRYFLLFGVLAACGFFTHTLTADKGDEGQEQFREGGHYHRIDLPQPTQSGEGRIEVVELFFYACPHCNKLQPKLREWLKTKPEYVDYRRIPAIVGPTWADQARAYYVAEELGILDQMHEAFFESIHKDGVQYYNELAVMQFFAKQGVDEGKFLQLYRSEEVTEKVSQARVMTVKYGLKGVPAMIVNGRYKTASYYTRNLDEMLVVVDALFEKERVATTAGGAGNAPISTEKGQLAEALEGTGLARPNSLGPTDPWRED